MEKHINNKNNSIYSMVLKKISLMILLLIFSIMSVNAITQTTISSCPANIVNDTEYILQSTFVANTNPCFNFNGGDNNVIINGNNTNLSIILYSQFSGTNTNVTIKNLKVNSYYNLFSNGAITNNLDINNIRVNDLASTFLQIPTLSSAVFNNLTINNNYIRTSNNVRFMYVPRGSFTITNFTLTNNELSGFSDIMFAPTNINSGASIVFSGIVDWNNNIMSYTGLIFSTTDGNSFTDDNTISYDSCTGKSFTGNYDAKITLTDTNGDFVSDSNYLYTTSGCAVVFSGTMPTKANSYFNANEIYFSRPFITPTMYENNKRYMVGTLGIVLNSTEVINLQNVQNVILDLSLWENNIVYDVKNTNVLRMGTFNTIYGGTDLANKPIIQTSGSIQIPLTTYFGNLWQLITYDNKLKIENIRFNLNAGDNYGLVRKKDTDTDGIDFIFKNNYVYMNFVPVDEDRPLLVIGAFSTITGNTFDLPSSVNVSVFGWGISDNVGSGHKIYDNIFNGGGYIFMALSDAFSGTNYPNKFIHNKFDKVGSTYSRPFHPTLDTLNLMLNPQLNGSYFYTIGCDNYEYNIGNYYRDWADSSFYNDSNGDGIHDSFNGVNYITRGDDYAENPINDYRSITPYPYNFAGQTGNALSVTNTCLSFAYNINTPTNLTTSSPFNSNWEFVSSGYNNLYCEETINGNKIIYNNVSSGVNKGQQWTLGTGSATFDVKCCNSANCDNVVQQSQIINFCIGSCSGVASVISTTPISSICGNTIIESPETCDDGNIINGDGCSSVCSIETNGGNGGNQTNQTTGSTTGVGIIDITDTQQTADNVVAFAGSTLDAIMNFFSPFALFFVIIVAILAIGVFLGA